MTELVERHQNARALPRVQICPHPLLHKLSDSLLSTVAQSLSLSLSSARVVISTSQILLNPTPDLPYSLAPVIFSLARFAAIVSGRTPYPWVGECCFRAWMTRGCLLAGR